MGKRVKKALEAVAAQARTGDPAAIARYASEMSAFAAAEAKKKHVPPVHGVSGQGIINELYQVFVA